MHPGTGAKIWIGIQHIEPINKTKQTLLKALLPVGIKGLIWKYSFYLFSIYNMLCIKTTVCLVHRCYEYFCLLNNQQNLCQATLLCLAVTGVPFGWRNSALGVDWVCITGVFYGLYSEHRVASVESPLDHHFSSQHTPVGCNCLAHADYFKPPGIIPGSYFSHTKSMKMFMITVLFYHCSNLQLFHFEGFPYLCVHYWCGKNLNVVIFWRDSAYTKALKDISTALF